MYKEKERERERGREGDSQTDRESVTRCLSIASISLCECASRARDAGGEGEIDQPGAVCGFGVEGLGLRGWGLRFIIHSLWCVVQGLELQDISSLRSSVPRFGVSGFRFRASGEGIRV